MAVIDPRLAPTKSQLQATNSAKTYANYLLKLQKKGAAKKAAA